MAKEPDHTWPREDSSMFNLTMNSPHCSMMFYHLSEARCWDLILPLTPLAHVLFLPLQICLKRDVNLGFVSPK